MTTPPSGTVTFFFTDIEGSTKLWETFPEAMKAALARHDGLLRRAIEEADGYVFKTIGDAFCAAFPSAAAALAAALAAQQRLAAEPWGEVGEVRVRMALHTGQADERDADYFGPTVNRVARLLATGHGGQVVLSAAARNGLPEPLPPGVTLLDLGDHRLKDLQSPEHVFQLVHPDLVSEFPPLRSLDHRPNNLPVQPTPLIGREAELAELHQLLTSDGVRLVNLVGFGGTGKTRLALQAAADTLEAFRDGTFFVPLDVVTSEAEVGPAIAQALHLRDTGGRSALETVEDYLRERQALLLLDNFEHVMGAAGLVAGLLAACPRLKLLVTSRFVLNLRAERQFPVAPLAAPPVPWQGAPERLLEYPAAALFVDRAAAVRPGFALDAAAAPAVAAICARLDGLPLAIELAAARSKLLAPAALLDRLERRLPLLTGGARDLPRRQQTMQAAIAWSHDLLEPGEQALFARLGAFAGGFDFEAAEAVCGDAPDLDVLDGLASLVDKSLLRQEEVEGAPRFTLLETIREFAAARLAERPEAAAVMAFHAQHYLTFAETTAAELRGATQAAGLARLEREHGNLRVALLTTTETGMVDAAVRLAVALFRFWALHGHVPEGRAWLARLLALPGLDGVAAALRARLLERAAQLALWDDDWSAAGPLAGRSRGLYRELGDRAGEAAAQFLLAGAMAREGEDIAGAERLIDECLAISRSVDDRQGAANALSGLARIASLRGDDARARTLWQECLALYRETGERVSEGGALGALGRIALRAGDATTALAPLEAAMALWRELGDEGHQAETLHSLGQAAEQTGDPARARALWEESLAICRRLGDRRGIAEALDILAARDEAEGDRPAARARLEESAALWAALGDADVAAAIRERIAGLGE